VESAIHRCFPLLAARPPSSAAWAPRIFAPNKATSPLKTRVGGSRHSPSGRSSRRRFGSREIATGCRQYAYKTALGRTSWPNRDPINEPGARLISGPPKGLRDWGELNPYAFCENNPLSKIDPDGREVITVAITAWSLGKGISHLICGSYYCSEALKCRNRAQETLEKALPGLQSTDAETALKWAEWLRSARPGEECAELWAACGREGVLTAQWVVGGYIVKYGIRYAGGYGRPEP